MQKLINEAIELIEQDLQLAKHIPDIEEPVMNLCLKNRIFDPGHHKMIAQEVLRGLAMPKVNKAIGDEIGEDSLGNFVKLLSNLIDFFEIMGDSTFEKLMTKYQLDQFPSDFKEHWVERIIAETKASLRESQPA